MQVLSEVLLPCFETFVLSSPSFALYIYFHCIPWGLIDILSVPVILRPILVLKSCLPSDQAALMWPPMSPSRYELGLERASDISESSGE